MSHHDHQHTALAAHAGELPILEHDDCDMFDEIADIINETYA